MKLISADPQCDPLWEQLSEHPAASVFNSAPWLRVLARTYDMALQAYLLVDDDGQPVAGIPFCRIQDMNGKRIVTVPFSDYCDPLVEDGEQWQRLVEPLFAEECAVSLRCVHSDVPLADGRFNHYYKAKWHAVDLRPDEDSLWNSLHSSARRAVRKAQDSGVEVCFAHDEQALRAFFEMHLQVRKHKYRMLAQPYRFFQEIWREFISKERGAIALAVQNGQIIAGVLFLEWQNRLYYKFNASAAAQQSARPNDLIMWEGIKYGQSRHHTHMDLGLTDWDQEGLARYKRKYAGEEKTISFLRYRPDGTPDERERQMRGLLPQITDLFTEASVPDQITERAGDVLYQFFV